MHITLGIFRLIQSLQIAGDNTKILTGRLSKQNSLKQSALKDFCGSE